MSEVILLEEDCDERARSHESCCLEPYLSILVLRNVRPFEFGLATTGTSAYGFEHNEDVTTRKARPADSECKT